MKNIVTPRRGHATRNGTPIRLHRCRRNPCAPRVSTRYAAKNPAIAKKTGRLNTRMKMTTQ
ncbi:MAG: hypothetical protein OXQ93_09845 [Gemmatimonadota bacterium]|nr:hypothetical protein [Gemmatimonadota bacterium]